MSVPEITMNLINSRKELRKFGYSVGLILLLIAIINWKLDGELFLYFLGIGGILIFFALIHPESLSLSYRLWMRLAFILNTIVTTIILTIVFYLVLTPISLVSKIFGKKFIDTTFHSKEKTYWQKHTEDDSCEKQF